MLGDKGLEVANCLPSLWLLSSKKKKKKPNHSLLRPVSETNKIRRMYFCWHILQPSDAHESPVVFKKKVKDSHGERENLGAFPL